MIAPTGLNGGIEISAIAIFLSEAKESPNNAQNLRGSQKQHRYLHLEGRSTPCHSKRRTGPWPSRPFSPRVLRKHLCNLGCRGRL